MSKTKMPIQLDEEENKETKGAKYVLLTSLEVNTLKKIRAYFGENIKTPFEHSAYATLDVIVKKTK